MYIVEGNIGVGKSTFLSLINQLDTIIDIVPEPLENWANKDYGQSLLKEFYSNTSRWAYTIETLTMMCRVRDHLREAKVKNPLRLIERSVYSGHYCFAKNDYANKHLSSIEWTIYLQWVDFLVKKECTPPLGFIYLQASPEVCYERVLKRARESEKELTLEYIEQIHQWHEKFLVLREDLFENLQAVPVLILDCNKDFVENRDVMQEHVSRAKAFLIESSPKTEKTPSIKSLTS